VSIEVIFLAAVSAILLIGLLALWFLLQRANRKIITITKTPRPISVPEPTAAELEAKLKAAYEAEITKSTQVFAVDLQGTSTRLSEQVSRLTTQVIEEELGAYQSTLEELRKVAAGTMDQIRSSVESQRLELRTSMEADIATERERLLAKFEAKMGDIVASYITESLGGGIDLGSQMNYIVASLEAHKDDIRKDLTNGV
jgi:hypothetical protein